MRAALLVLFLAGCGRAPEAPQPGRLRAGVATGPLDAPIGISMGGYRRSKAANDPGSKFAKEFPASTGALSLPTARALALDDGLTKVVLVRADLPLATVTLQVRSEQHLHGSGARLVLAATHTHAGPGRFFRSALSTGTSGLDITALAMDKYDAELEDRLARSIAKVAREALADLRLVAVGHASVEAPELNADRRCQNDALYGPGYRDTAMRVVRLDETDEHGDPVKPLAALLGYAAHGTVLGSDNTLLSGDAPGALEAAASERLGVPFLYLQGAAGDVSPTYGGHDGPQALEWYGQTGAARAAEAFELAAPKQAPAQGRLRYVERGVSTTRAGVGYAPREFPEFGAVGCGLGGSACEQALDPKNIICLPLSKTGVVQTLVSAVQVEDALLVMLPGEPMTAIAERVREAAPEGIGTVLVVGYAGDHSGYLLEEADFLRGGYEPSVTPWGWKFADHLTSETRAMLATLRPPQTPFTRQPIPEVAGRRAVEPSAVPPAVVESPADLERLQTARFRFHGGEATPRVWLAREGETVREPLVLRLSVTPSYAAAPDAPARTFEWSVEWETLPSTPLGRYRLHAQAEEYALQSDAFEVKPARAVASAELSAELHLTLRWPPHPVQYVSGTPSGGYRLREAAARGGQAVAKVTAPDGTSSTVTFRWNGEALVAPLTPASGRWVVELEPGAFTDAHGNTNGTSLRAEGNQ